MAGRQQTESNSFKLARILGDLTPERLSLDQREATRGRIIDAIGVALNGRNMPAARAALSSIYHSPGPCTIWGEWTKAVAEDAAFVNATMAHATLQEDTLCGGHQSIYVVPAALAIAEEQECTGLELLTGVVAGYEVVARLASAIPSAMLRRGFRIVPTIGAFGAGVAAAKLLHAGREQMAATIHLAANMACGIYQAFYDGTQECYFHAGFAARNGIVAARLAMAGAATSSSSLEGKCGFFRTFGGQAGDSGKLLEPLGDELAITRARSKPFPSSAQNQETMLALVRGRVRRPDLTEDQIARVILYRAAANMTGSPNRVDAPGASSDPPYNNMLQAQLSAKFTAAAALAGKPVDQVAFYQHEYADEEVGRLASRIELITEEREDVMVQVILTTGEHLTFESRDGFTGDHRDGVNWTLEAPHARFMRLAEEALGSAGTRAVLRAAEDMDTESVRTLTELVRGQHPTALET